ncbi:MAG TPA: UDP-glucose/GDP-mannose dehydrogenase family protein [Vicinamibacterales bacterium]|nr:UDP-glucose/GDP-mannose dehydrogenase family protein [Vicinamibacterales bacterium]
MRINIFGLGYVGSVSAACLAASGNDVLGVDIDQGKVDSINKGVSAVVEPGLSDLIRRGVRNNRLRATTDTIEDADLSMVCVGTPSNENGSLCLDHVEHAAADIGAFLQKTRSYHVVCIRSTVLPGTVQGFVIPILEQHSGKKAGRDFGVCMNPEFLREGTSIRDYDSPPFTIIGELDAHSGDIVEKLYAGIQAPLVRTTLATAEMVKYAGNAYHALKITFANEIGNICKRLGLDGKEVMEIFCRDQKLNVSAAYLQPGFAFGGSCLPKDLRALLYKAKQLDVEPPVLRSILASNVNQIGQAYRLIQKSGKKKVAVLGLSFKPGTDDLRESPTAELIETMIGKGYQVSIYDREVSLARLYGSNRMYIEQTIPHISCLMKRSIESALEGAEVIVVAKRSPEFQEALERLSNDAVVVDLANVRPNLSDRKEGSYEGICW